MASILPAELNAYFARIGYDGPREPTLAALHGITSAHSRSIPFENLDVLLGRPIEVEPEALSQQLVHQGRGGYCFQQNGLLLHVLLALGFEAIALGARVRIQRPRDYVPARTHMFVRVEVEGESWLTDVGVGGLSLTSAIRLNMEEEQPTPHEPRRIVRDGARWFHQVRFGAEWNDVYDFTLDEMPFIDREIANWFTSTHPRSPFKSRLIVARALPEGSRVNLENDEFSIRERDGRSEKTKIESPSALLDVLGEHFGLRFPPDTRFEFPGSPWLDV